MQIRILPLLFKKSNSFFEKIFVCWIVFPSPQKLEENQDHDTRYGGLKMKQRRTDLAMEGRELWQESAGRTAQLRGVEATEGEREGLPVTTIRVLDREGEQALGKPVGRYVTLTLNGLAGRAEGIFSRAAQAVAGELGSLIQEIPPQGLVLVAGLGNRAITPDAIGPKVHENTLVTRHLVEQMPEHFGHLRPVASLSAEVLGNTGVESGEVVRAVCEKIHPTCVIAVDALASRSLDRLCRTVQLADTGIAPGSGVGNHRFRLDRDSLGVPVIAIGVPTVVDGATLAADLLDVQEPPRLGGGQELFVTPKDIDSQVADLAKVIGYGISMALQPGLTVEELDLLLS